MKQFTGLDLSPNEEAGSDNSLAICDNFSVGDDGTLIKRQGIVQYVDTPGHFVNGATPIGLFDQIGTTTHYVIVSGAPVSGVGHTYSVDTNGVYAEIKFTDTAGAGANSDNATSCTQLQGALYLTLNSATRKGVWKWTGTGTATFLAGSPNIDGIIAFKERLYGFSKAAGNETRIYYSDSATGPDHWLNQWRDVQPGDGDYITCILPFKDRLIIFKNNAIWQLFVTSAPATWIDKLLHPSLGTFNKFSAEVYKNSFYFVHNSGCYSCDGTSIVELSTQIRSLFQPIRTIGYITINRSWIYVGSVVPGQVLVYKLDSAFKAWTTMSTPLFTDANNIMPSRAQGTSLFDFDGSAKAYDTTKIYIGANNGMYTLTQIDPTDPAAVFVDTRVTPPATFPIAAQFLTKQFNIGRMSRMKRNKYSFIYAQGKNSKLTYSYVQDNDPIVGDLVIGADNNINVYRIDGAGYFRVLQLKVTEVSDKPLLFMGFSFVLMLQRQAVQSVIT